mgnify:CR=1 FL=1
MSNKTKTIIGAVLVFLSSVFGWYVAFSDGDDSTKPDTDAVIEAGKDIYNAATEKTDTATTTETVTE